LYAGSYWPYVQISNRKERARNSQRVASLRDMLGKGQAISSRKKNVFAFKETISVLLTVCLLQTALTFNG